MNCSEFDELFHDLDRPRTIASRESELALAHAEACARCARLLTEAEALNYALRAIALRDRNAQAPARLESALLREFREHNAHRRARPMRQSARWYAAVGSIAALALLTVGLAHFRLGTIKNQPVLSIATTPNVPTYADTAEAGDSQNADIEDATAFVSLPDADDFGSLEGGVVVRVAMPRATLASWGLPISDVAGSDRIPAELLVSADGTPQAVRLVSVPSNE
jgi:hypothetical protein